MKTCLYLISASIAMSAASANAQGAVYDAAVEAAVNNATSAINTGSNDIIAKLTELLDQAKTQNQNLEKQLARTGDPANLYANSLTLLKEDVKNNAALLKSNDERATMLTEADGTAVFGRATYGITAAVNETVTLKDGTVVNRDAEKYQIDGKMLTDVDEYRRIRGAALDQKKALAAELQKTMADLEGAQDFGSIQKYGTLIQVLQGQIASADRAAEQALNDMEVLDREIKIQSSAARKASAEKAQLERDNNAEGRSNSSLTDRQNQINDTKQTALQKAADYMTKHSGTGYTNTNTAKGPNLQWKKSTDQTPEVPEETPEESPTPP